MRFGEECPYKTPCGFCGRKGVECTESRIKGESIAIYDEPAREAVAIVEGGGVDE